MLSFIWKPYSRTSFQAQIESGLNRTTLELQLHGLLLNTDLELMEKAADEQYQRLSQMSHSKSCFCDLHILSLCDIHRSSNLSEISIQKTLSHDNIKLATPRTTLPLISLSFICMSFLSFVTMAFS